ncbi:MAG: chlorite dismutase family protein [Chloroflexota bacterium]|nr:chlorite dismutase family protein [Chloroflexota bacterium]
MTTTESRPAGASADPPTGKQFVKFSFFRLRDDVRAAPAADRAALASELTSLIERSAERMLTRTYSTVGTRADTDFLIWQVSDDLGEIQDWHGALLGSDVGPTLERSHSFLSMTMRSIYSNPLHAGAGSRDRLRDDGGTADYLFVYPMVKTKAWYQLPQGERQAIMNEHIAVGHKYHDVQINTTYSYGLDDQEFVVAFEADNPGRFLALVRELRTSRSTSYTERDTPMFTCRRQSPDELMRSSGLRG